MAYRRKSNDWTVYLLFSLLLVSLSACNLGRSQQGIQQVQITALAQNTVTIPTESSTQVLSTLAPATAITLPTRNAPLATRQFTMPTAIPLPINTVLPTSIFIQSPYTGAVVSGEVEVIGFASHPNFRSYRVEYSNDPNRQNLWYPITGDRPNPVFNQLLGTWDTANGVVPDGIYQLRLLVMLQDGSEQIYTLSNVRVQNQIPSPVPAATAQIPAPVASFTQDVDRGTVPLLVSFTSQSQGNISTYHWNFGDGNSSTEVHPRHTYTVPGQYTVNLIVNGPGGSSSFARQLSVENIDAPVADFEAAPTSGEAPLTVQFTDRSSKTISAYNWNFGDNSAASAQANPVHTYLNPGNYDVKLVVSGPGGQSSALRQIVVSAVQSDPPIANFEASTTAGAVPLTVQLNNLSSGDIDSIIWDFNDDGVTDSEEWDPLAQFNQAGEYLIRLTVSGSAGQSSTTQIVRATDPVAPPIASFSADPIEGPAPLTVVFNNTSAGADIGYAWDFDGDGSPETTAASPTTTFETAGAYTVILTAAGAGGTSTASAVITVSQPLPAPVAAFTTDVSAGYAPLQVQFSDQSTGEIEAYEWDFQGDGLVDSIETSPVFIFESPGIYQVHLKVFGPGAASEASAQIEVLEAVAPPTAGFIATLADLEVAFVSTAIGEGLSYSWDFGDGNTSLEQDPLHTYAAAGNYTVAQTVSNLGGSDTYSEVIAVSEVQQPLDLAQGTIAFVSDRDGNNEIYLMNADGANPENLSNHPADDRHPSWSPDGSMIAFASQRESDRFDIYLIDRETRATARLTDQGSNTLPAWSPDGGRIAFVSDRFGDKNIMVMNADGSNQRQLTFDTSEDDQPTWSPDGNSIAYSSNVNGNYDIHIINATDGTPISTLTSDAGDNSGPAWLNVPGQSLLAFSSTRAGNADIYLIDPLTAQGLRQITGDTTNEWGATWSPDAALLAFVSDRGDAGEQNIYTVTLDSGNLQRLTPDGSNDRDPKWQS